MIPSGRNHFHDLQKASLEDPDHDRATIVARSRRDRGPIAARSWPDRDLILSKFEEIKPQIREH